MGKRVLNLVGAADWSLVPSLEDGLLGFTIIFEQAFSEVLLKISFISGAMPFGMIDDEVQGDEV